jgi:hypothetical protein
MKASYVVLIMSLMLPTFAFAADVDISEGQLTQTAPTPIAFWLRKITPVQSRC